MGWGIREQADFVNAEIGQNLTAETNLAQDALMAVRLVGAGLAMEEDAVGLDAAIDVESAAGVVQIDERTASCLSNLLE